VSLLDSVASRYPESELMTLADAGGW
jgi:hypothetical protein